MDWHDCQVVSADRPAGPSCASPTPLLDAAAALGIVDWRISLSHDAGIAAAVVLALGAAREIAVIHAYSVQAVRGRGAQGDRARR